MERLLGLKLLGSIPRAAISNAQPAYRKGRSTETALHVISSLVEKSLHHKEYAFVAFLDIEGDFNNILPCVITGAPTALGVDSMPVRLIDQILRCKPY